MTTDITPHKQVDGHKVLNIDNDCTYFMVAIAGRLSSGASALYRKQFDIGIVEWRCMVMFALEGAASAARISQVGGLDKALVSRSLARLEERALVEDHEDSKKKPRLLQFTARGRALYEEVLETALKREQFIRQGLSDREVAELLRMLRIVFQNAQAMEA